jgi:alkyl sulfatase BDS1-like metallo-beta-lactamase superfamily hydrolase
MHTPLYRSRPGGFDLRPASMPAALRINDFIYASHGLSNSYLVLTSEGRVVINTGMGFEAPVHKRNFDAVDRSPVRYILLTQGHVDHVGGVDLFKEAGTRVVAHAGNRGYQDEDNRLRRARGDRSAFAFRKTVAEGMRATGERTGSVPAQSVPAPDLSFEHEYAFELGGLRFQLIATPGGETTESMVVWLPQHEILFSGNVFGALWGHIPNLVTIRGDRYRDALGVVATIEKVMALEPRLVLYGHHEPIEGKQLIRSELERLRDAVLYVHDRTVEQMNGGKDVWTAMREIELPPQLEVGQGYGQVSWDVRAIWENYLGWFHHHSTSELYPSPPWEAHADLVELAGGPEPIAARARRRLEGGEAVLAIRLAEVALAAAPEHRAALQVSLDAHRALERETGNFWLLSWLREQIERLGQKLGGPSD